MPKFIVDQNVGKLAKWLRLMGYDTRFFNGSDDSQMVSEALAGGRIILTKDSEIMKRRLVTSGQLNAVFINSDEPEQQMQQLIRALDLDCQFRPFTLCLECNQPLEERSPEEVTGRVPPYVFRTKNQYMECPTCHRIYWRGTHWEAMTKKLENLMKITKNPEDQEGFMDVYEAVARRRSIRNFKDRTVPYALLEKCVNAGRLAPSGRNRQPCEFIIIDDESIVPQVCDCISGWAGQPKPKGIILPSAPKAYLIIMINRTLETEVGGKGRVALYDVGMAAENMILTALEEGIGACPLLSFQEEELKQLLQVSAEYDIALVIAMGYPDESPIVETATDTIQYWVDEHGTRHVPKRKLEDITHRNKFT